MGSAVSCSKDSRSKQELDKHPHPQLHCVSDTGVPSRFHYVLQGVTILQTTSHWAWLDSRCASFPLEVQEGNRFGSIRFGSGLSVRFGLVRFGKMYVPVRRDSACIFRTHRGSVWFGSVPRPVLAGSRRQLFGSVRFGRFSLCLIPSCLSKDPRVEKAEGSPLSWGTSPMYSQSPYHRSL